MPSIKQLKAEIQTAHYFTQEQKLWLTKGIDRALLELDMKKPTKDYKIRTPKKAAALMTLEAWEEREGCLLNASMFAKWGRAKKLCPVMVGEMVSEFRMEMLAKGKLYADFRMTFQVYLTKGYLSKKLDACTLERSPHKQQTVIHTKGNEI